MPRLRPWHRPAGVEDEVVVTAQHSTTSTWTPGLHTSSRPAGVKTVVDTQLEPSPPSDHGEPKRETEVVVSNEVE
jgi:hypothetical protein